MSAETMAIVFACFTTVFVLVLLAMPLTIGLFVIRKLTKSVKKLTREIRK